MAKAEQGNTSGSAAQQREQAQQQWQQGNPAAQAQPRNSSSRTGARRRSPWFLIECIVVIVVMIVAIFIYLSNQPARRPPSSSTALKTITHIAPSVLARVGTGSASKVMNPVSAAPPLTGPTGKPELFYVGADYCPFCAAQRWAMIVALSRFGTFSTVSPITSSEGSIPTFTFHNSTYTSHYIDFVPVETEDNQRNTLQHLTPAQEQLLTTYDAPPYTDAQNKGAIPFIDIANRLVSLGAYYSPEVLVGHSWDDIANQINEPTTDISRGVLGTANYLTAAICLATQNQPTSVCAANPIPPIEGGLPQAFNIATNPLGISANPSKTEGYN